MSPLGILKFNTVSPLVPTFVTDALEFGMPVLTVPTDTAEALGILKLNTAEVDVPLFVIVGFALGLTDVTVPNVNVPEGPVAPVDPVDPVAPVSPLGIVKFNTASPLVPELLTEALVPAFPVVTVPTDTLAARGSENVKTAADAVPLFETEGFTFGFTVDVAPKVTVPAGPSAPIYPSAPRGMLKFNTASPLVPTFVTVADDPAFPVLTVPTDTLDALGNPKAKTAADDVPVLDTVGF